jgi:Tol biopolymer transport system component
VFATGLHTYDGPSYLALAPVRRGRPRLLPEAVHASSPAWSPADNRIVYTQVSADSARYDLYSIRPDGRDRELVVENATMSSFSPDGSKLAYVTTGGASYPLHSEVAIANADGSDARIVSDSRGAQEVSWSPDGKRLAFTSWVSNPKLVIVVARLDSSRRVVISSRRYSLFSPAWRPAAPLPRATRHACT